MTFTRQAIRHISIPPPQRPLIDCPLLPAPFPDRGVVSGTLEEGQQVDLMVEPLPGSTSPRGPHTVLSAALLRLQDGFCGALRDAAGGGGIVSC